MALKDGVTIKVNDLSAIFALIWVAGFVIADGFWSTVACIFPPWSFYLVIEHFMIMLEWI